MSRSPALLNSGDRTHISLISHRTWYILDAHKYYKGPQGNVGRHLGENALSNESSERDVVQVVGADDDEKLKNDEK